MQALHFLELFTTYAARLYVLGGELLSITAILFCLNSLATLIKLTYQAGKAIGRFYFRWLHSHCQWLAIRSVALLILLATLSLHTIKQLWNNRSEHLRRLHRARNTIGQWFVYKSPVKASQDLLGPSRSVQPVLSPVVNQFGLQVEELFQLTNKQLKIIAGTKSNHSKNQKLLYYM